MAERNFYSAPEVGRRIDSGQWHSTLEVGQRSGPPQSYSTLESRQPDFSLFDSYKQSITALPEPEIFDTSPKVPRNLDNDTGTASADKDRGSRKRALWILVALCIAILVAAAAIGGE